MRALADVLRTSRLMTKVGEVIADDLMRAPALSAPGKGTALWGSRRELPKQITDLRESW